MSLVAVVVPTYNRPDYLSRLLRSMERQSFRGFHVIVVDDNSPDRTGYQAVIEQFSSRLRLTYVRNEKNSGAQFSRNRGVSLADSEFVAFVDDDDEWLPEKLQRQVSRFESLPANVGLLYAWADAVDQSGSVVFRYRATHCGTELRPLLESCFMPSPTIMVRRTVLREVAFDEEQPSCQDWDMWTRIVEAGYAYDLVAETLALYHKHERPSVGQSPRSLQGFFRYYSKHESSYLRHGMIRELSEKYRGLASEMTISGLRDDALRSLQRCVQVWPLNWKGWIRLLQARITSR